MVIWGQEDQSRACSHLPFHATQLGPRKHPWGKHWAFRQERVGIPMIRRWKRHGAWVSKSSSGQGGSGCKPSRTQRPPLGCEWLKDQAWEPEVSRQCWRMRAVSTRGKRGAFLCTQLGDGGRAMSVCGAPGGRVSRSPGAEGSRPWEALHCRARHSGRAGKFPPSLTGENYQIPDRCWGLVPKGEAQLWMQELL